MELTMSSHVQFLAVKVVSGEHRSARSVCLHDDALVGLAVLGRVCDLLAAARHLGSAVECREQRGRSAVERLRKQPITGLF